MLPYRGPKDVPTFSLEDILPKFPLHTIADTLARYRRAALPFCENDGDVARLDGQLKDAEKELLPIQQLLERRFETMDNYVHDDWWSKYAYLEERNPITPIESTPLQFGWSEHLKLSSPIQPTLSLALVIRGMAQFHRLLEKESFPALGYSPTEPISMLQFRSLFNCCRIPWAKFDEQARFFRTEKEFTRKDPRYICLGIQGRLYKIWVDSSSTNTPVSVAAIQRAIEAVAVHAETNTAHELRHVGFLTGSHRDTWAEARALLVQSSTEAQVVLNTVERALFFVSLDNGSPDGPEKMISDLSISPDGGSRWYDQSTQLVMFRNGKMGFSMEHSMMDVAAHMAMHEHVDEWYSEWLAKARESGLGIQSFAQAEEDEGTKRSEWEFLSWGNNVPKAVFALLSKAEEEYLGRLPKVWKVRMARFRGCGREFLKGMKVSADSFCQMAFQDAYTLLYNRVPSTYESVGVLRFRHGRTETGRCVSVESKAFVDLSRKTEDLHEVGKALRTACTYHEQWIKAASEGKNGFDRHFFAIRCICREQGIKVPEFLNDPILAKASKWELSTSNAFLGGNLQGLAGGTTFRPVGKDSIGIVYAIFPQHIDLTIMTVEKPYDSELFLNTLTTRMGVLCRALILSQQQQKL